MHYFFSREYPYLRSLGISKMGTKIDLGISRGVGWGRGPNQKLSMGGVWKNVEEQHFQLHTENVVVTSASKIHYINLN